MWNVLADLSRRIGVSQSCRQGKGQGCSDESQCNAGTMLSTVRSTRFKAGSQISIEPALREAPGGVKDQHS
jgi:hypothetical protein